MKFGSAKRTQKEYTGQQLHKYTLFHIESNLEISPQMGKTYCSEMEQK